MQGGSKPKEITSYYCTVVFIYIYIHIDYTIISIINIYIYTCIYNIPIQNDTYIDTYRLYIIKGSLGGETSVLRTFRMSGKELVRERLVRERVHQGKS